MAVRRNGILKRFQIGSGRADGWIDASRLHSYNFYNTDYLWLEIDFCDDGSSLNINPISLTFSASIDPKQLSGGSGISCSFYTENPFSGGSIYKTVTGSTTYGASTRNIFDATRTSPLNRYLYARVSFTSSAFHFKGISISSSADVIVDAPTVTLSAPLNTTEDGDSTIRFSWSANYGNTNTKIAYLYYKKTSDSDWTLLGNTSGGTNYLDVPGNTLPLGAVDWRVTVSNGYASATDSAGNITVNYDTPVITILSPAAEAQSGDSQIHLEWSLAKGQNSIARTQVEYSVNSGSTWSTLVNENGLVTEYNIPAHYFSSPVSVQWRVRCEHSKSGWGNYATSSFTVTYVPPTVTLTSPAGGASIQGSNAVSFAWSIANGSGNVTGTQLEYSTDSGSTWTSLVDYAGKTTSKTVSAGTFPVGTVLWRVRARDQYDGWSEWVSDSFTITEALPVVSGLSPNGVYRDRTGAIVFSWVESISFGTITGAELQYDLDDGQGWQTLGTVSGTTAQHTAAADTFPAQDAIAWRVRAKNSGNEYGSWASASFATVDAATSATPTSPVQGMSLDETEAITFQWSTSNALGSEPSGADLQYRYSGDDWQTLGHVNGSAKQFSAPANTFIGATIYWRVRAYNQDGTAGSWSNAATFSTLDTTPVATAISPDGTIEDTSKGVLFRWRVSNQSGTLPRGADLQYSHDGSTWIDMGPSVQSGPQIVGNVTSYEVPGGTITAGTTFWRVRSYNRNLYPGNWSSPLSFVARAAPVVSSVEVVEKPWATVIWQADDQQAFEVFVDGNSFGSYFGTEKEYSLPDYLKDGNHTIGVRVMGSYGLWSQIHEVTAPIENTQAQALTLRARTNVDAELSWQGGIGPYYIYRDGEMICKTGGKTFTDRTALGSHNYYVIERLVSGDYNASPTITRTPSVECLHIAALDGGDWIVIPHTLKSQSDPVYNESQETEYNHISGMDYPTASIGKNRDATGQYSAVFLFNEEDEHRRFKALRRKPVIIKTADGEVMIGVLHTWERTPKKQYYTAYQFTVQRIGWEDFIDDTN